MKGNVSIVEAKCMMNVTDLCLIEIFFPLCKLIFTMYIKQSIVGFYCV